MYKKHYKIVVLEDSRFYNSLLSKQLKKCTDEFAFAKNIDFDIKSFTSSDQFLDEIKSDTDIAFLDYFLEDGITALDLLAAIKEKCKKCKVVIMSQAALTNKKIKTFGENIAGFIFKDKNAISRSCFMVEDIITGKLETS